MVQNEKMFIGNDEKKLEDLFNQMGAVQEAIGCSFLG